jgi:flagellar biosynthesis regulator FlbT
MRLIQRREDLRFPLEPGETIVIAGKKIRQDFDRDVALELGVAGAIDLAHATRAQGAQDFVRSESSASGERHEDGPDYIRRRSETT